MFGSIKKAIGLKLVRSSFDSAFNHVVALPLKTQKEIAVNVKQKIQASMADDPHTLERRLNALNHQARSSRQMLVQQGLATNQSNPHWLEAALLESFAVAGLSADKDLCDHVGGTLLSWIKSVST